MSPLPVDTTAATIAELLINCGPELQKLLPPGWPLDPNMPRQAWGDNFVVYELGQLPDGRHAKIHHFLRPDTGPPHCHWCEIESHGLVGSYVERTYKDGRTWDTTRPAGGHHIISADTIHRLTELPHGPAWTLVMTGPHVRQGHHHPDIVEVPHHKYHSANEPGMRFRG